MFTDRQPRSFLDPAVLARLAAEFRRAAAASDSDAEPASAVEADDDQGATDRRA